MPVQFLENMSHELARTECVLMRIAYIHVVMFDYILPLLTHRGPTTPNDENVVYIIAGKGTLPDCTNEVVD